MTAPFKKTSAVHDLERKALATSFTPSATPTSVLFTAVTAVLPILPVAPSAPPTAPPLKRIYMEKAPGLVTL